MREKSPKLASVHSLGVRIALALVLLVVTIGLVNYAYHSRVGIQSVVSDARADLSDALAMMQSSLQQALRDGNINQAQSELATFSADPDVLAAVLVDSKRTIIAASRRAWLQENFDIIMSRVPSLTDHWEGLVNNAVQDRRGEILEDAHKEFLAAAYPLRLPQSRATRRHTEFGFLAVTYDMRPRKANAEAMVRSQTGFFTGFLVMVAILLWAVARLIITARVERLVHAAGQLAAGNLRTRVRLSGSDELAALGRAFDRMAQKIAHNQNKLYEHERQLRSLLESTAEGIIGIDNRGQCTFCNAAAASYLGIDNPVALLHKDVASLFGAPPRQSDADFRASLFHALENAEKLYIPKIPLLRRDGRRAVASLRIHPMEQDGHTSGAVASFMDVTEQQETRRNLAKASVVFEHSAEAIVVTDRNGIIEQANNAYSKLTGIASDTAIGRPLAQLLKWESLEKTVWNAAETTGTWQGEIWQTRADGSEFPSWTTVSAVNNSEGDVVNFIIMFTDITEKKNW